MGAKERPVKDVAVSDRVHFWPHGEGVVPQSQPFAAIVTFVHARNQTLPQRVNLAVFNHEGKTWPEGNVRFFYEEEGQRP